MAESGTKTAKQPNPKKDLLLLFSIPIAIVVIAAAILYIPRLLANPGYDFIYYSCKDYSCSESYQVDSNGHINRHASDKSSGDYGPSYPAEIRYYDIETDSSRTISLDEANSLQLNSSSKAPDGYELSRDESGGGLIFYSDYDSSWNLEKGLLKKNIQLTPGDTYYYQDVNFLGWVEK